MKNFSLTQLNPVWGTIWIIATVFGIAYILQSANRPDNDELTITEGTTPGKIAPDFTLETISGDVVQLSELRGRPIVLNFWASWCGPCRVETPHFEEFAQQMGEDVLILGVNQRENPETIKAFQSEFDVSYPLLVDMSGRVSQTFSIFGLPTTFIIDQDGIIRAILPGGVTEAALHDQVNRLLE